MAKRITWSKYEIALLFKAYEHIANGSSFKEQSSQLSDALRQLASFNGISIDQTFRNTNGINMQLHIVQYLFTDGEKGLPGASIAFRHMYDVYNNNHAEFESILHEAAKMLEQRDKTIVPSLVVSSDGSTASHNPIKRITWDKFESALLFNAYENIVKGENFKLEAQKLSNSLRQYAINRGIIIDDTYRNVNGMNMHLSQVQYLFTDGKKGLPSSSKATRGMYKLYKNNHKEYTSLLRDAIRLSQVTVSNDESTSSDDEFSKRVAQVESYTMQSDLNGCTINGLASALNLPVLVAKKAVALSMNIVIICDKLIHKDAFVDWELGAEHLQKILDKLMKKNNGYVSASQLYEYAKLDMTMFINDNNMDSQRKIFDMAEHLFSKENYHDVHYSFQGNSHITYPKDTVTSRRDLILKYARDEGGFFNEANLEEYLHTLGISGNTHARQYMKLYSKPDFLFYEPGCIITAESIGITSEWLNKMKNALNVLFNDVGDHIVIRDIQPVWYDLLPDLPSGRLWTPLLLQSILRFYSKEVGAKTICALDTQFIETLHAMLVTLESEIQNFSDAVLSVFVDNQIAQLTGNTLQYSSDELHQLLVEYGLISGNELINTLSDALPNDDHFKWDLDRKTVTIKYN